MKFSHLLAKPTSRAYEWRRSVLLIAVVLSVSAPATFAQDAPLETQPPAVDLLKLSGSKPNLSPTGEGITSIKTTDFFQPGLTEVKPFESEIKLELPVGYSLFNKLAYIVKSDAVFSGPNDFLFRIPSATTKGSFQNLRILYAEIDTADPGKPLWVDATLEPSSFDQFKPYLNKDEFDKRLPDFKSRTLHGFMEPDPMVLVVAIKDPALARDRFKADLLVTGKGPAQVMQGRKAIYDLQVTNLGPDAATDVRLHTIPSFNFVSISSSVEKCRFDVGNVYCKFAKIAKGETVSIKLVEKEDWGQYSPDPSMHPPRFKSVDVAALEQDPISDNNDFEFYTEVLPDPNKPPVAELVSPQEGELFDGPSAEIKVVVKASDPDGMIGKVEFFDWETPVGEGTRANADEFEMVYANVAFGRHQLWVRVTDNLGRDVKMGPFEVFVNGRAQISVISPKPGQLQNRSEAELSVVIHASHPALKIKDVFIAASPPVGTKYRGQQAAVQLEGETYAAKVKLNCDRKCRVWATAIDETGVETHSEPVDFTVTEAPEVKLYQYDGETFFRLSADEAFDSKRGFTLAAEAKHESYRDGVIVKMDFFVNEKRFCTYETKDFEGDPYPAMPCSLQNLPAGTYKIQVTATDSDGSIGKSALIEIEIKK